MELTHGELFAGISGFGQGFERHGIETKWHVEIDKTAQSVLRRHYPNTLLLDDVRTVGAHNLPPVDIITFGSPCQDLSVAGRRKGLAGERSGLFYEAIRIIGELKPTFAIWENVPGAFSSNNGRDFAYVLAAFLECGARDIAWATLDAQYFGVAQRRRRVFVVADFAGERAGEILFVPESGTGYSEASREARQGTAAAVIKGAAIGRQPHNGPQWGEYLTDDTCYTLNATEVHAVVGTLAASGAGTARPAGQGNELDFLIPTGATEAQTYRIQRSDDYHQDDTASTLAARDYKSATDLVVPFSNRVKETGGVTETLRAGSHGALPMISTRGDNGTTDKTNTEEVLRILRDKAGEEAFTEWGLRVLDSLQSAQVLRPCVHVESIRRSSNHNNAKLVNRALPRTKANRRGSMRTMWITQCEGRASQRWKLDKQQSRQLRAYLSRLSQSGAPQQEALRNLWQASEGLGILRKALPTFQEIWRSTQEESQPAYTTNGVRRLTPQECELLQGFPDGWTEYDDAGGVISDSARYRMLGNAICANVAEWIGKRITALAGAVTRKQEAA